MVTRRNVYVYDNWPGLICGHGQSHLLTTQTLFDALFYRHYWATVLERTVLA